MFDNNPVKVTIGREDDRLNPLCNPDPYMIEHEGVYYCYSTGWHGVNVLRSTDLTTFEHMGLAFSHPEKRNYWAPAVFYYNGLFYMYYSCMHKDSDDPHTQCLQVAVSDNPLGPFEYKKTFMEEFSIDPHVVEQNGELYIFYTPINMEIERIGVVIVVDKLLDPFTLEGKPRLVVKPTIDQEIFIPNRQPYNRDWYTIEGGFYFEHDGVGFLMYSGNAFMHSDYFVGYSTCDASLPLSEAEFTKYPDNNTYSPLIGHDEFCNGCGHNSIIKGPNGEWLIVYHGRSVSEAKIGYSNGDDGRRLCISEVRISGKKLEVVKWQR